MTIWPRCSSQGLRAARQKGGGTCFCCCCYCYFEARSCLDRPGTHSYSPASDSQVLDYKYIPPCSTQNHIFKSIFLKKQVLGLKRWLSSGAYVCFCRGPGLSSQNSHGGSQKPVIPIQGNPVVFCTPRCTYAPGKHTYALKTNKQTSHRQHSLPAVMETGANLRVLVRVMMSGMQAWKGDSGC